MINFIHTLIKENNCLKRKRVLNIYWFSLINAFLEAVM